MKSNVSKNGHFYVFSDSEFGFGRNSPKSDFRASNCGIAICKVNQSSFHVKKSDFGESRSNSNSESLEMSKWPFFETFDFTENLSDRKIIEFPHCVFTECEGIRSENQYCQLTVWKTMYCLFNIC